MNNFYFGLVDTRAIKAEKGKKVVIRGYAAAPDLEHVYKYYTDKTGKVTNSLKSLFTQNAVISMRNQFRHKKVFVDVNHELASKLNIDNILEIVQSKNPELSPEITAIKENLKMSELPLFRVSGFDIDDQGLKVEVESNPYFAEIDSNHERYYNAIMNSVQEGYINGLSVNFNATRVSSEEGIDKIDDVALYGISLVDSPALGAGSRITEMLVRSIQEAKEATKMEPERKDEKIVEKIVEKLPDNFDQIVAEKVTSLLKEKEIEQQKQSKEEDYNRLKAELEQYKQQADSGTKSVPKQEIKFDEAKLRESINALPLGDVIRLQAEFGGRMPILIPEASFRGKHGDPRATWSYKPLPQSWAEKYHLAVHSSTPDELRFTGLGPH